MIKTKKIMRIGIYNVFTSLWFILMLTCGGWLTYAAIAANLFFSDLIFIAQFFIGLISLITIGIAFFLILNFKLLFIRKNKLFCIRPFIFKLQKIDLTNKLKIKWDIWQLRGTIYRTVKVSEQKNNVIKLSDFEFENFDNIINQIDKTENNDKKTELDFLQAKANISFLTFSIPCDVVLFAVIVWLNLSNIFHWIHIVLYFILLSLIYSALTKRKKYKRIIKQNNNNLKLEMNNENK
jgi:hypothetical protein